MSWDCGQGKPLRSRGKDSGVEMNERASVNTAVLELTINGEYWTNVLEFSVL
jgi:hypothetical protein